MTHDEDARRDVTEDRRAEVERVVEALVRLVDRMPSVVALGMCGSWAAGRPTMASDLDLVLVTSARQELVADAGWVLDVVGPDAQLARRQDWGPLMTELRLRLVSGLEVELGVVDPAWAATTPVDPGTARVVRDGFVVVHDPTGALAALVVALSR